MVSIRKINDQESSSFLCSKIYGSRPKVYKTFSKSHSKLKIMYIRGLISRYVGTIG